MNKKRIEDTDAAIKMVSMPEPTDHTKTLTQQAIAAYMNGRGQEALTLTHRLMVAEPGNPDNSNLYAAVQLQRGRADLAVGSFGRAVHLSPSQALFSANWGVTLRLLGQFDLAASALRRAATLDPTMSDPWHNLGALSLHLGQREQGRVLLNRAWAADPVRPINAYTLVHAGLVDRPGEMRASLQSMLGKGEGLSVDDHALLHIALGRVLNDSGDGEGGFRQLLEGNRLKRQSTPYDEAATNKVFAEVTRQFSRDLFSAHYKPTPPGGPIFIVGMPRAGTSLTEQILASHSGVHGAGELEILERVFIENCGPGAFPGVIDRMASEEFRRIGDAYRRMTSALAPGAGHIVDKMPLNFFFCGLIALAMPEARIIHIERDPIDTCLSCFSNVFAGHHPFKHDLAELGRYYSAYRGLMSHWREVLPNGVLLDVRYEDVVADLEGQARRILDHCGLAWEEACLSFQDTQRPVLTASYGQVRNPLYKTAAGRWRPSDELLQPLISALADGVPTS